MKKLYNTDILLVTLLAVFSLIFLIFGPNNNFIGSILGYLLMLFLPGYSIITIFFPRKNDLKNIKRLVFSFIFSIGITILIGLLLIYIPSETRLTSILILISAFTLFMQPISFLRRKQVSERFNFKFNEFLKNFKSSFNAKSQRDKIIFIVMVIFIVIIISTTAYIITSPEDNEKFTEFYILGSDGKADNYPTNLITGESGKVIIGIVNHEAANTTYRLIVKINDAVLRDDEIFLMDNEKKEIPFTFVTSNAGQNQKLEFLLYKLPDDKNVYRYLYLQINVN